MLPFSPLDVIGGIERGLQDLAGSEADFRSLPITVGLNGRSQVARCGRVLRPERVVVLLAPDAAISKLFTNKFHDLS